MNENETLKKIAHALVSICERECCDYGFSREVELAEQVLKLNTTGKIEWYRDKFLIMRDIIVCHGKSLIESYINIDRHSFKIKLYKYDGVYWVLESLDDKYYSLEYFSTLEFAKSKFFSVKRTIEGEKHDGNN